MSKISIHNNEFSASITLDIFDVVTLTTQNNGRETYDVHVIGTTRKTVRVDSTLRDRVHVVADLGSVRDIENKQALTLSIQRVRA